MERICFMLRVRPDRLAEYREAHRNVWPEMLDALRRSGWRNYSLFLGDDGLLIGYFECDNLAEAQAAMADSEVNSRWQLSMAGYFANPQGERADESLVRLGEVFHLD